MAVRQTQVASGLWFVDGPTVRFFGMPFPTRMLICRLASGELFVYSPISLTAALRSFVSDLGQPRYLVSPNKLHHLFIGEWQDAFPQALCYAPPGLSRKRSDLRFDGELGDEPEPAWAREIDQLVFRGSRLVDEVVFFHRETAALILGDLVQNFDPASLAWPHRLLARAGGVLAPHGKTPLDFQLSYLGRGDRARDCYLKIRAWRPASVIMCHGLPVFEQASEFLDNAFAWTGWRADFSTAP